MQLNFTCVTLTKLHSLSLQEELENLRTKLDKVETERTHYKNENERLETKVSQVITFVLIIKQQS